MIHTVEHEGRVLHAVLFNNKSSHLVWMVASWTRIPGTVDRFYDWTCYIGAAPETWPIDHSIITVKDWGTKVDEQAARAYFGGIAERYGAGYRS